MLEGNNSLWRLVVCVWARRTQIFTSGQQWPNWVRSLFKVSESCCISEMYIDKENSVEIISAWQPKAGLSWPQNNHEAAEQSRQNKQKKVTKGRNSVFIFPKGLISSVYRWWWKTVSVRPSVIYLLLPGDDAARRVSRDNPGLSIILCPQGPATRRARWSSRRGSREIKAPRSILMNSGSLLRISTLPSYMFRRGDFVMFLCRQNLRKLPARSVDLEERTKLAPAKEEKSNNAKCG